MVVKINKVGRKGKAATQTTGLSTAQQSALSGAEGDIAEAVGALKAAARRIGNFPGKSVASAHKRIVRMTERLSTLADKLSTAASREAGRAERLTARKAKKQTRLERLQEQMAKLQAELA